MAEWCLSGEEKPPRWVFVSRLWWSAETSVCKSEGRTFQAEWKALTWRHTGSVTAKGQLWIGHNNLRGGC